MKTTLLEVVTSDFNSTAAYIAGALIAIAILGYLIYSLIKPEKF